MTDSKFWQIIEEAKKQSKKSQNHFESWRTQLELLPLEEIVEFQHLFEKYHTQLYRWDVWGAGYILNQGCSNGGFDDFRGWLIAQGQDLCNSVMNNVEILAEYSISDKIEERREQCEGEFFFLEAYNVYEEKMEKLAEQLDNDGLIEEMPLSEWNQPEEPLGNRWEETPESLAKHFPKLWAKFGW